MMLACFFKFPESTTKPELHLIDMARLHIDSDDEFPDIDLATFQLSQRIVDTEIQSNEFLDRHCEKWTKKNSQSLNEQTAITNEDHCKKLHGNEASYQGERGCSNTPPRKSQKRMPGKIDMFRSHFESELIPSSGEACPNSHICLKSPHYNVASDRQTLVVVDQPQIKGDFSRLQENNQMLSRKWNSKREPFHPLENSRRTWIPDISYLYAESSSSGQEPECVEAAGCKRVNTDTGQCQKLQNERASFPEIDTGAILIYSPPNTKSPSKFSSAGSTSRLTPPQLYPKQRFSVKRKGNSPYVHKEGDDKFLSQTRIDKANDQDELVPLQDQGQNKDAVSRSSDKMAQHGINKRIDHLAGPNKRKFDQEKYDLGESFLTELDLKITGGKIAELTASGGGVRLVWSKKLNTTAGRANWKREVINSGTANSNRSAQYRHHASIELAEKVINNNDRLLNVIAHEYCHLATFMIDNIQDKPHGKAFKEWARKCSTLFGNRGILVTTKHSYDINYKYTWQCQDCGLEYKRHSKSIDPRRHACGNCKSQLVQTRPSPRMAGPTSYQLFVKHNYKTIREDHPHCTQKELMGLLGKAYKMAEGRIVKLESDEHGKNNNPDFEMDVISRALEVSSLDP
ncbi:hypothetical protein L228DRAFT_55708 [Xylona heveae TC161]|uniref:SprT-like domain-containing protein n=1 Tax=Xylona heveae (strain CBS 132557 / TC161) TaxID=1328760 RepID=A0A164ZBT2_XYLHT|nr:hypothetical protein L228DRAFT_55708 [Xylona heveae TC161]KZF18908.1 hypothetical protein L228DRAFT_55708 [Xylona heveae TC161]